MTQPRRILHIDMDAFFAFGDHPKRGALNLQDVTMKRPLHSAVTEAKEVGAFDVLDLTRTTKDNPPPPEGNRKSRAPRVR